MSKENQFLSYLQNDKHLSYLSNLRNQLITCENNASKLKWDTFTTKRI